MSVLTCSASLCCSDGRFVFGRSYSNERFTVSLDSCRECRTNLTIRDLQTFAIWCRRFSVFCTSLGIPADLFDVSHMMSLDMMPHDVKFYSSLFVVLMHTASRRYSNTVIHLRNCEPLNDELQVSWTVDQIEDRVSFQLCGCVDAGDYMAFGLSGSDSAVQMVGADAIVTWHDSECTGAVDYYLASRAQVSGAMLCIYA